MTDVRGLADGTLLHTTDTGRIYKMVGGAPVWQATCNDNICSGTPRPTTQGVINAGPATPRNATSAIDQRGRIYIFVGGFPVWQDSCAAPVTCGTPVKISDWSIDARDHMNQVPADGNLVQAKDGKTDLPDSMTVGGTLVPFANPQQVIAIFSDAVYREALTDTWVRRFEPWLTLPRDLPEPDRARLTAARLLADGYWTAAATGVFPVPEADRAQVLAVADRLTKDETS